MRTNIGVICLLKMMDNKEQQYHLVDALTVIGNMAYAGRMKFKGTLLLLLLCCVSGIVLACPAGTYKSITEEAYLRLTSELYLEIKEEGVLVFSGRVKDFAMDSEYEIFEVIPNKSVFENSAKIHLGGTCENIKIYWWEGNVGDGRIKKYFMQRISNKDIKQKVSKMIPTPYLFDDHI